jgi:hypothetical protein
MVWNSEKALESVRAFVQERRLDTEALADGTADHLKARHHRGQASAFSLVLAFMDELDRNGPVEPL